MSPASAGRWWRNWVVVCISIWTAHISGWCYNVNMNFVFFVVRSCMSSSIILNVGFPLTSTSFLRPLVRLWKVFAFLAPWYPYIFLWRSYLLSVYSCHKIIFTLPSSVKKKIFSLVIPLRDTCPPINDISFVFLLKSTLLYSFTLFHLLHGEISSLCSCVWNILLFLESCFELIPRNYSL